MRVWYRYSLMLHFQWRDSSFLFIKLHLALSLRKVCVSSHVFHGGNDRYQTGLCRYPYNFWQRVLFHSRARIHSNIWHNSLVFVVDASPLVHQFELWISCFWFSSVWCFIYVLHERGDSSFLCLNLVLLIGALWICRCSEPAWFCGSFVSRDSNLGIDASLSASSYFGVYSLLRPIWLSTAICHTLILSMSPFSSFRRSTIAILSVVRIHLELIRYHIYLFQNIFQSPLPRSLHFFTIQNRELLK